MKRFFAALLALCMVCLAGCAKKEPVQESPAAPPAPAEPAPAPQEPQEPETAEPDDGICVYTVEGLDIPVPSEYVEWLTIDTAPEAWSEHWTSLISLSETASVEAFAKDYPGEDWGMGWLCSVSRLDRIGFEEWASGDSTGAHLFARDDAGQYYLLTSPTDVRFYRGEGEAEADEAETAQWTRLNEWAQTLPDAIIESNGLTAYDASDILKADYTYGGEHIELGCRFPGQSMDLVILSLSQPEKQGEGGVWCVERVHFVYSDYDWTDTHLVFPAALGVDETAEDYYARIQRECDAGEHPEFLAPRTAALDYARHVSWLFGEDVSETDFEFIEALG